MADSNNVPDKKLVDSFWRAVFSNQFELAEQILNKNPTLVNDEETFFVLTGEAAKYIQLFLDRGVDIDQTDENGTTALGFAVEKGNLELVDHLLNLGANPNKGTPIFSLVSNPFHSPVENRFEILNLLVAGGVDINQELPNLPGVTIAVRASEFGDIAVLERLKELESTTPIESLQGFAGTESEGPKLKTKLTTLPVRLANGMKLAWDEVREARKNETFYFFALVVNSDLSYLNIFCNTEEQISRENLSLETDPISKWFVDSDYALYGAGVEHLEPCANEVYQFFDEANSSSYQGEVLKVLESALKLLDKQGYFEKFGDRRNILLAVEFTDADVNEEKTMKRIINQLNPKQSTNQLLSLWK